MEQREAEIKGEIEASQSKKKKKYNLFNYKNRF